MIPAGSPKRNQAWASDVESAYTALGSLDLLRKDLLSTGQEVLRIASSFIFSLIMVAGTATRLV